MARLTQATWLSVGTEFGLGFAWLQSLYTAFFFALHHPIPSYSNCGLFFISEAESQYIPQAGTHYIAQAGLELMILSLPSTGMTDLCHSAKPSFSFFTHLFAFI